MQTRPATVSFKTVGCRLNQAETAIMRSAFEAAGYKTVPFGAPCDIGVIHGCVVTAKAEEDSRRLIRSIKRRYPNAFTVLAGCAAEYCQGNAPPSADYLAGQSEKYYLPHILAPDRLKSESKTCNIAPPPSFSAKRAIVKIQDGCDCRCAYCIVPQVRGASRSRPAAEIIAEITKLTLAGFTEIILTGANLGGYADGAGRLPQLLEKVEAIESLPRFRISSLEISNMEREMIDFLAGSKKMCFSLHLPLQSGSNRILKAMGRPYTAEEYCALIESARQQLGLFGLGTDIIVGFPGETEADFQATAQIVNQLPFSKLHVFRYSPRPGTAAAAMPESVSGKDQARRAAGLLELGRRKRNEFAKQFIGKKVSVLVEQIKPDGWAAGWTGEYLWARVRTTALKLKQIVPLTGARVEDDRLVGTL